MTLLQIETACAAYLEKTAVGDFTVLSHDLFLNAVNQAKMNASLLHDFNFQRKLLTVNVDSVTGGSLGSAVIRGTATTVDLKTIIDIGQFDAFGNFVPTEWTTTEDGLNQQRSENPYSGIRYATDADASMGPAGRRRFTVTGDTIYSWPKTEVSETLALGIEAYVFDAEWTATDLLTSTLTVTGTLSPDIAASDYNATGLIHNGSPVYFSATKNYLIYLASSGAVGVIADAFPETNLAVYWAHLGTTLPGTYATHAGGSTGTATVAATTATSDVWTTKGAQYLQWATIVQLNHLFKQFLPRQEGNLPPPQTLADAGLQNLITWDIYKYEGFRRHGA